MAQYQSRCAGLVGKLLRNRLFSGLSFLLARVSGVIKASACVGALAAPLVGSPFLGAVQAAEGHASAIQLPSAGYQQALRSPNLPPAAPRVYAITAERRALLNTIRYAEGTWANGQDVGYRIMYGGGLMDSLDRHPNRVIHARYSSAAAGAYQFMPPTWAMVSRALGFQLTGPNAFGPEVQDQAAIYLVQRRGALQLADQGQFTPELAHRLAPEWASFPTMAGRSFYGQPVKRYEELRRFYEFTLANLRAQQSNLMLAMQPAQPPEPPKPECLPAGSLRCQLEALDTVGPRNRRS